jgi:hypothetical protein
VCLLLLLTRRVSPLLLLRRRGFIQSLLSYEVDAERDLEEEEELMVGSSLLCL